MSEQRYRIVTTGQLVDGFERSVVEANLAKLCRFGPEKVAQVLSGERFVFKSGVTTEEGRRYLAALKQAGVVSSPEPIPPPATGIELADLPSIEMQTDDPLTSRPERSYQTPQVTCPKCGTVQNKAVSCVQCHVLMDRYRQPHPAQTMADDLPAYYQEEDEPRGFPLLKVLMLLLVVCAAGGWLLIANPFASKAGDLDREAGLYENRHFKFALNFPETWNSYTVKEAIKCATINREYADQYLLLVSPTNPEHCLLVVNICGITLDYFKQKGWAEVVKNTGKRHKILYESVEEINGLTVYRKGYNIAQSYREDAYFDANGTLIEVYFTVKRSFDTADRAAEFRRLLNEQLRAI